MPESHKNFQSGGGVFLLPLFVIVLDEGLINDENLGDLDLQEARRR